MSEANYRTPEPLRQNTVRVFVILGDFPVQRLKAFRVIRRDRLQGFQLVDRCAEQCVSVPEDSVRIGVSLSYWLLSAIEKTTRLYEWFS